MPRSTVASVALTALTVLTVGFSAGCGTGTDSANTITVFAASSLHEAFDELAAQMEAQNPELNVVISYDGSQNLVDQLIAGAPAQVVATADEQSMRRAEQHLGLRGTEFTTNSLVLITQSDNPRNLTGVTEQLNQINTVVCAPEVPCGAATEQVFAQFPWELRPVSQEQKVTDVAGKVHSGQADAGVVYRTEADGFTSIDIPGADQANNKYFIAATDAKGATFADFVLSAAGQRILSDHGFGS